MSRRSARLSVSVPEFPKTKLRALENVRMRLQSVYGRPALRKNDDPLAELMGTILSQNTNDRNSHRAYVALRKRYRSWRAVLLAPIRELVRTIKVGGLANTKARHIQGILRQLQDERGRLSLNFLCRLPVEEARLYLRQFKGVGPKTIACVLLFACRHPVFPIDTHIRRIGERLGWFQKKHSDALLHAMMERVVPACDLYSFHVNLIRHGREICHARGPLCHRCVLLPYCDYGSDALLRGKRTP